MHENLIQCFGAITSKDSYYIVTEYVEQGSLAKLLRDPTWHPEWPDWPFIYSMALQISRGVEFLHSHNIMHR
jgi:serine/threonine protein kinase